MGNQLGPPIILWAKLMTHANENTLNQIDGI